MKLRGLLTLLVGALLLGVGCTTDADINTSGAGSVGRVTTVKISATLPDFGGVTRGYDSSKGGTRNIDWNKYELRVIAKAYGDNSESEDQKFRGRLAAEVVDYIQSANSDGSISIDLDLPLTSGHTYDVYLWADYVLKSNPTADLHYDTSQFPTITLKSDALVINDESRDAFFARNTAAVGDGAAVWSERFNIERAVAKLRMVATDAESAAATMATLQMDTFYGGFNIATAEAINKATGAVVSDKTAFETYSTESAPDTKSYITAYMLWPASANATIVANFYEEGKTDAVSEIAPTNAIPLKRGNLTTLRGEMFESGWDGKTTVEPMTIDGDWLVLNNAKELAWVLQNGDTKGKYKVRITCDMDMGGNAVKPFPAWVSEFDGAGHKISNFAIDGEALFTPDDDYINEIKIHDLNIEDATIENSGHVGVLVNRVGINATFENITIKNSSATTSDGAAGGVVGYIGGGTGPALEVKFINCDLENVKSSGTLDEGIFVGRMHGYNDDEILSFDADCSADANCAVTDFKSPYTEDNDAQWLDEGDSAFDFTKYNGWLGDEEINRGVIKFEGHRMQIKWDGKKTITPMTDDSGAYLIYSPFDLAYLQEGSHSSVTFMSDVDMNGVGSDGIRATPIPHRPDGEVSDDYIFKPIYKVQTLNGNNKTIYNLSVEMTHDGIGAGFIQYANGTTTHKNLTLNNADIKNYHTETSEGNAYAGTMVATVTGTYTSDNIKIVGGNMFAICKTGGLYGRLTTGTFNVSNCSVDGMTIKNYDSGFKEDFLNADFGAGTMKIEFESDGEIGGLIGFITGANTTITNCSVKNCNFYCTGETDWELNLIFVAAKVPGRHINPFIGDIRTTAGETVLINNYTISNNNMHTSETSLHGEKFMNHKYKEYKTRGGKTWDCVGFVYAVTVKFNDVPGTVKINNSTVMVSESFRK